MNQHNANSYEKMLGALEGDAFEEEVCARLLNFIADFQRVPSKPGGDAGLDGLSHGQTHGYCCYGPEQEPFKKNTRGLQSDILKKFRSDLRRLFELEFEEKKLVERPNVEMKTILAPGRRLTNVYLVVSWFETHRIIGPLNESFEQYKTASSCAHVAVDAQLAIWGPKDLATQWLVDELALFRIEQQALVAKVKKAMVSGVSTPVGSSFDAKFEWLRVSAPAKTGAIDDLADHFRKSWSAALTLDNELAMNLVSLHETLEHARAQLTVAAHLRSSLAPSPFALIGDMRDEVRKHLGEAFGDRLGPLAAGVADGEIARLMGECPIEWRK